MSKFVLVKKAPEVLEKHEYVVNEPSFMEEIKATARKRPKNKMLTVNYLRELIALIGGKYIGEEFSALTDINVSRYVGSPCDSEESVNAVLNKIFKTQYPKMFDKYIEFKLKSRPRGTTIIYFTGPGDQVGKFLEMGFQQLSTKELEEMKSDKPKKVVGKPAITDEAAAQLNDQV